MAIVLVCEAKNAYVNGDNNHRSVSFLMIFMGADVPSTFLKAEVLVDVDGLSTIAGLHTAQAAAARAYATTQGFSVPVSQAILPEYSLG